MLTDLIARLRPTANTVAGISDAIERCHVALREADAAVTAAQEEWERSLLDADLKRLTALEEKLSEARTVAAAVKARVEAVLSQLETRLAAAKRSEAEGRVSIARRSAEEADKARRDWWEKNCQTLAALLRQGEQLDSAFGRLISEFEFVIAAVGREYPDANLAWPTPAAAEQLTWRDDVVTMMRVPAVPLQLPSAEERAAQERVYAERDRAGRDWAQRNFGSTGTSLANAHLVRG